MHDDPGWLLSLAESIVGRENLATVIRYISVVGLVGHLAFLALFLWLGVLPMAAFNVGSCILFLVAWRLARRGHDYLALFLGTTEIIVHAIAAVTFVGWDSGFALFIMALTPVILYSQRWRFRNKVWMVVGLAVVYVALYLYALNHAPLVVVDRLQLGITGTFNAVYAFVVFAALAYAYRLAATTAETALQRANRALDRLAHTDPLTQLANRRQMHDDLERAIAGYRATGTPFCLLLGDIDHFKAINDQYGHEAGDEILVQVADVIRESMRDQDRVARWGGEEFLILLAATPLDHARAAAERLLDRIASAPMATAGHVTWLTMTLGAAEYAGEADATECIRRADAALYAGKQSGRNRVITSNDVLADVHVVV